MSEFEDTADFLTDKQSVDQITARGAMVNDVDAVRAHDALTNHGGKPVLMMPSMVWTAFLLIDESMGWIPNGNQGTPAQG